MIEVVTFTGVDAKTDLDEVVRLAMKYPFAEFGVLIRSITDQGNPRFPSLRVISDLNVRLPSWQKAIHLCGIHAQAAAGPGPRPMWAYVANNGFGRIQINLSRRSRFGYRFFGSVCYSFGCRANHHPASGTLEYGSAPAPED